ncbi:hypothetical protein SAMD00019534_118650 [Acytostelium subglobosum LB1]|uniref:hypothetical protein n=1 Tax=Acytostelium subglobosum LB1 TaxID=1410327 RepID=UPI000644BD09|nr:hypothetical protein SAMD00019534_118650 [Acytostelium subglobosum LB1]GAM28689.1 hypothetical protein SAMD00019534_118650 [Acytostelium subglobosum LB1]|eukprot:XP_012748467.1 hypothetical protein SAMD00019534_118650 [Acytostelium subglobosum LB1]
MVKIDAALAPLFVILGTAATVTIGFGVRKMSTDNDISMTRKGQMLWVNNDFPKMVDVKQGSEFYNQVHTGSYLRSSFK